MKSNVIKTSIVYLLALVGIMFTISSCGGNVNTNKDPNFDDEGKLIQKPEFFSVEKPSQVKFFVEVSSNTNGFYRTTSPTKLKSDVYNVMSKLVPLESEVTVLTSDRGTFVNGGTTVAKFKDMMDSGICLNDFTLVTPILLNVMINDIQDGSTAVLISNMIFSPVGNESRFAFLGEYCNNIARILGDSHMAVSLIAAKSEFKGPGGDIIVQESPYYYLVIGKDKNVAFVRNAISSLLEANGSFIDNIETGFDYKLPSYSFGPCTNVLQLEGQPTFTSYNDSESGKCTVKLKVDLENYRWLLSDKNMFSKCFKAKTTYGSDLNVGDIKIDVEEFDLKELKRKATATVDLQVSNMTSESEVIEWYLDLESLDTDLTLLQPFLGATSENDRSKSYSMDSFIRGMFEGIGKNKVSDKKNYILISKKS